MHSAKQKISNAASSAKEKLHISNANIQEKASKVVARSKEEKEIAHERKLAKEAEANMHLHEAKAQHAAEKLDGKMRHNRGVVAGASAGHHTGTAAAAAAKHK